MIKIGIYQITNLASGKFYIGQSRYIYKRWQYSTSKYTTSALKDIFKRYKFDEKISLEGTYGNFKFETLKKCNEKDLIDEEIYYRLITKLIYGIF